jgi:hypothetical protein
MYGKLMRGILVVETEEIEWLFEVHGRIPECEPARLEARMSARRNYGREPGEVKGGARMAWQKMKAMKGGHGETTLPLVGRGHGEPAKMKPQGGASDDDDDDSF